MLTVSASASASYILLLALLCFVAVAGAGAGAGANPYKVLGVSKSSTQEEIRKSYRALCRQYHPDKNVGKSEVEQRACLEKFKQIQSANHLIGDEESRRQYDMKSSSPFPYEWTAHHQPPFRRSAATPPPPLYRNDDPFSEFFDRIFRSSPVDMEEEMLRFRFFARSRGVCKSIYVQSAYVGLSDLYTGVKGFRIRVKDSFWRRYLAAYRGGAAAYCFCMAFAYALLFVLLPFGGHLALLAGLYSFHSGLPRLTREAYEVDIKPGYKGSGKTIFKFESDRYDQPEVVLILKELPHKLYKRVGNNLHTTVHITASQARQGCRIPIPPLDPLDDPIPLQLEPGQAQSGVQICLEGQGWPIRNQSSDRQYGDLIVTVQVPNMVKAALKKTYLWNRYRV